MFLPIGYNEFRNLRFAPLAQLDRAFGYGPEGRGFESLRARQSNRAGICLLCCFLDKGLRDSTGAACHLQAKKHPVNGFSAPRAGGGTAPVQPANPSGRAKSPHTSQSLAAIFYCIKSTYHAFRRCSSFSKRTRFFCMS